MSSAKTQPARGMRDFLPADVRKREHVIGVIKQVYERYGFEPLETPAVENIETLMGKYGEEGNQLIFKILKRGEHAKTGEADLALRYDLTVPLARFIAANRQYLQERGGVLKRYQIQPVWRADRPGKGRFREFYQCDVDVLGTRSMVVEAELIAAASDALVALGFNDFTIRVNHRGLLDALLTHALIPKSQHSAVLTAIDKLDKIGIDGVAGELEKLGLDESQREPLLMIFDSSRRSHLEHKGEAVWNWLELGVIAGTMGFNVLASVMGSPIDFADTTSRHPEFEQLNNALNEVVRPQVKDALTDLISLFRLLRVGNVLDRVKVDFSLARGLSYYTGAVFEINVPDFPGSLGGGGRYDNLVGMFLGKDVPACGFSLGLERIVLVMDERNMFASTSVARKPANADVMVSIHNEEMLPESIRLAAEFRAAGLRVDAYPEIDSYKKQFRYASSTGVPFVAIVGPEELTNRTITVKDMRTGSQETYPRELAAAILRDSVESKELDLRLESQYDLIEIAERVNRTLGTYRNRLRYLSAAQPYLESLPTLVRFIRHAFVSVSRRPEDGTDFLIDQLNRLSIDDFNAILIMCLNGQGNGAVQIIPSMYERLVTSSFLHKHPDATQDYIEYWQAHLAETFDPKAPDEIPKWKSIYEMASDVGLEADFRNAYYFGRLFRHATTLSLTTKWHESQEGLDFQSHDNQDPRVKIALPLAHFLAVRVIVLQIEHFKLEEDSEFQRLIDTYTEVIKASK